MGKAKDITGEVFGRLTAIEPTEQRKNGSIVWKCECVCGNIAYVPRVSLIGKNTLSCGCLKAEKTTQRNKKRLIKDISNMVFGRLTAIAPTDKRHSGYVVWRCECVCGNRAFYESVHNLLNGNTKSCGCYRSELAQKNAPKNLSDFKKDNYVANTRLDTLFNSKPQKNNTSGYKGVSLRKTDGKYIALIAFQKKNYFLGSYYSKAEAVDARKLAEKKLHGDFLEWYENEYKKK